MTPVLASVTVTILTIAFVLVCALMMLVILIQKPKGGGLSGAFGGAGGSAQAAFGARTGDVLTWVTVVFFVAFLLLAMGLTWTIQPSGEDAADDPDQTTEQTTTEADGDAENQTSTTLEGPDSGSVTIDGTEEDGQSQSTAPDTGESGPSRD